MHPVFSYSLKNIFVEPLQKSGLFALTRQQKIIGAVALAVFSLIALGCNLWQRSKKFSATINTIPEPTPPDPTGPTVPSNPIIPPSMNLVGIPNQGTSCYINAATMCLYPLREYFSHLNSPPLKVIKETYANPVLKASELVSVLNKFNCCQTDRAGGNSDLLLRKLLQEMVEEDPNLKNLFGCFVKRFKCGHGRPSDGEEKFFFQFDQNSDKQAFSIDKYLPCPICPDISRTIEDFKFSRYTFVRIREESMILEENLEWLGIKFKVISALKSTPGHASCVLKKEDGNWYHFNDSHVSPINPFGAAGYSSMILEKITPA
jgi:hypothetical protein